MDIVEWIFTKFAKFSKLKNEEENVPVEKGIVPVHVVGEKLPHEK